MSVSDIPLHRLLGQHNSSSTFKQAFDLKSEDIVTEVTVCSMHAPFHYSYMRHPIIMLDGSSWRVRRLPDLERPGAAHVSQGQRNE